MILGTLALFVVSLGYGVIVPLLPGLAGATGATALLSIVYAVYSAAKIGAQIPGGVWVDRAGAQHVLKIALGAFTISLAGFLIPGGPGWFALVRAVEGLATGLAYPAVCALAVSGAPPERAGRRIGATVGIGSSGLLVGPAMAGLLAPYGTWVPIVVALGVSAAVTLASLIQPEAPRPAVARTLDGEVKRLVELAVDLGFLGLCLPIAFNKLTFSAFQALLPLHGERALHLPLGVQAGLYSVTGLFALTGVCFAIAQPIGGWLADRLAPRPLIVALTLPLLASLGALGLCERPFAFTWLYAAYVTCSSLIFTATLKHAARAFGTDDTYGGVFGVLATLTDLMTILGPLAFLNLYGAVGAQVFFAMAIAGVPFALGFLWLRK
jgi:MFS family permease